MSQKQVPLPSPEPDESDKTPDLTRKLPEAPQAQELDKELEKATEKKTKIKLKDPECCGILPCKGRTQFCYQCDICLDCITAIGCGHSDSRHSMVKIQGVEEK